MKYEVKKLEATLVYGQLCWSVRHIGQFLGYSSNGGNLSHHIRGKWSEIFSEGNDYVSLGPGNRKTRQLWMMPNALPILFRYLYIEEGPSKGDLFLDKVDDLARAILPPHHFIEVMMLKTTPIRRKS